MRVGNYSRIFGVLIFLFSFSANAAVYTWTGQFAGTPVVTGSGPGPVCTQVYANAKGKFPDTVTGSQLKKVNIASYSCLINYKSGAQSSVAITRSGDACGAGASYDDSTGECNCPSGYVKDATGACMVAPNECQSKSGTNGPFSKTGVAPDGYMTISGGMGVPKQSGCFNNCLANTADQKCKTMTSGIYSCRGTAYYTGDSCAATGAPGVDASDGTPAPPPEMKTDAKPCVYSTDGSGKQSCTSTKTTEKEGQSCGTVNGVPVCVSSKPNKDTTTVTTDVTSQTNSDGTTTTTKTDTATQTKCSGMLVCSSGTTTSSTSTTKKSDGTVTGTTSNCKGDSCPDKDTNPDSDGDGLGDCIKDCDDGGQGGGPSDWYKKGEDTYESVLTDFTAKAKSVPVVSSVGGFLSYAPNGSCPRYSVDAWVFHIQLDQWCTTQFPWTLIYAVIVGTAAFLGFRIAFL